VGLEFDAARSRRRLGADGRTQAILYASGSGRLFAPGVRAV